MPLCSSLSHQQSCPFSHPVSSPSDFYLLFPPITNHSAFSLSYFLLRPKCFLPPRFFCTQEHWAQKKLVCPFSQFLYSVPQPGNCRKFLFSPCNKTCSAEMYFWKNILKVQQSSTKNVQLRFSRVCNLARSECLFAGIIKGTSNKSVCLLTVFKPVIQSMWILTASQLKEFLKHYEKAIFPQPYSGK